MRMIESRDSLERRADILSETRSREAVPVPDLAPRARRLETSTRLLMCAPEYFGVDYVINPWMAEQVGKAVHALARAQWSNLRRHIERVSPIETIPPAAGRPDMVFTANAGLAIGNKVIVSRFRAIERRPEEPLFHAYFQQRGYEIASWPEDVAFEGAGDALIDYARRVIWCGHGFRSSQRAAKLVEKVFDRPAIGLRLVDPRFYHLDTCLCPLSEGLLMYYPGAFDAASQDKIKRLTPPEKRIEVSEADAIAFACNAVEIDRRVFMNAASVLLQARLRAAGFSPVVTPLGEFVKAGGAAKCLTLDLGAA